VRLTPKARAERIEGTILDGDGQLRLKIAVTAPPEDGKANSALIKLLAKKLRVPPSTLSIVGGHTQRLKVVHVAGDASELARRVSRVLGAEE